jgi:UDPglucose 6-dehydrogenase
MQVTIIGAGYVGLLSAVCLAAKGHGVTCVDLSSRLVQQLNKGKPHIYEPGLEELLGRVLKSGRMVASTNLNAALDHSDIVMIAVGTPSENGAIDLRFIIEVSRSIGFYLRDHDRYLSVVVRSTVIPGTTDTLVRSEIAKIAGRDFPSFGLGMSPEFFREGDAIADFMEPDRIVLGYEDDLTLQLLETLYAPWEVDKIRVNTRSAELIKYANNVLLATQISTVNEIANFAAALGGIDVMDIVQGVQMDRRWSPMVKDRRVSPGILSYLVPGCGFGGSCFPKDLQALRSQGMRKGLPMHILNAVLNVNDSQPNEVVKIIEGEVTKLTAKTVMVLGLAFKPGTDDVRESPSLKIVRSLLEKDAHVLVHDPVAADNFKLALGTAADSIIFVDDWTHYVDSADVLVVVTLWPDYKQLTQLNLTGKILFDARRMFSPSAFTTGKYLSIGRRLRVEDEEKWPSRGHLNKRSRRISLQSVPKKDGNI